VISNGDLARPLVPRPHRHPHPRGVSNDLGDVLWRLITSHLPSFLDGLVDWLVVSPVEWLVVTSEGAKPKRIRYKLIVGGLGNNNEVKTWPFTTMCLANQMNCIEVFRCLLLN
jgi:hypothetical protein